MNFDFKFLEPYAVYILFALIGILFLYIRSFVQESAKVSALKRRNKDLVDETESIKKEYQLEISKRKYQYESKKEQYLTFFKIIDSFTTEANKKMQEKLIPVLNEFYEDFLNSTMTENQNSQNKAITVMSQKMQKISFDSYAELTRLRQETNTIRIIASDEILDKLNLLELSYQKLMDKSNSMMSALPQLIMSNNQEKIKNHQKNIEISANVTKSINSDIIKLMRSELNEI